MEAIIQKIKTTLELNDAQVEALKAKLTALGVTSEKDLQQLKAEDLGDSLPVLKVRGLVAMYATTVVTAASAQMVEETITTTTSRVNPLRRQSANSSLMGARINPTALLAGQKLVRSYILLGQGIDAFICDPDFLDKYDFGDGQDSLAAAMKVRKFAKDVRNGQYASDDDLRKMAKQMPAFFGQNWGTLMQTARTMYAAGKSTSLVQGGTYAMNDTAAAIASLQGDIPLVAEHMSGILTPSLIAATGDLATMGDALLEVLLMPELHATRNSVVADDPIGGAMKWANKVFPESQFANSLRLSAIAADIVGALANPSGDDQYAKDLGELANDYGRYYALIAGAKGGVSQADSSFRTRQPLASTTSAPVAQVTTVIKRRWFFSIDLAFGRE